MSANSMSFKDFDDSLSPFGRSARHLIEAENGAHYTPTILGHRPHCAISSSNRFAEFPRQERLNLLRPHLAHFGLFPKNLDPEECQITMTELKGLVRIWKLHNLRNFWRLHPSKDDIVGALHKHIRKRRELDEQLADMQLKYKQQQKDQVEARKRQQGGHTHVPLEDHGAAISMKEHAKENASSRAMRNGMVEETGSPFLFPESSPITRPRSKQQQVRNMESYVPAHERRETETTSKPELGMIYISRGFAESTGRPDPRSPSKSSPTATANKRIFPSDKIATKVVVNETLEEQQLRVKRKCSVALLNMSTNEMMQSQFVEQGALAALLELASSTWDAEVVLNCAACLVNLIPYGNFYPPLCFVDLGVVRVLVRIATKPGTEPRVRHYCILCLCRLSQEADLEERLIAEGALVAATRLVTLSESPLETRQVAAKVLINLAVTLDGNQIDPAVKNVLKCVGTLLQTTSDATQQFCAEAIASLSCLPVARPILAKQGVVAVLKSILVGSSRPETTNACGEALCNMGQIHGCRKEMLSLGLIRLMSRLLRMGVRSNQQQETPVAQEAIGLDCRAEETQKLCTLCLTTLSFQKDLRHALLKEGALKTIAAVVAKRQSAELTRQGAYALLNFAFDPHTREDVITEEALPALISLLENDEISKTLVDSATRANALMALCNLLADPATVEPVLEAGALEKMVGLDGGVCDHEMELFEFLSVAFLNLSTHIEVRKRVMATPGCAELLLKLTTRNTKAVRALFNYALDEETHPTILKLDLMGSLRENKDKDPHMTVMLVHVLTSNQANHKPLLKQGAVELLVDLLEDGAEESSKTAVAGSLYNLTQCEAVNPEGKFLSSVMALSHSGENHRVLWCAWLLANVSTHPRGRAALGRVCTTLVPCLLAMMRSGCADAARIQYQCAIAMCNTLSVFLSKESIEKMMDDGTVQDIIVITVLRANDVRTKRVLAQALFNLIAREDTRQRMIKEDVPLALIRLTKNEDFKLNALCAAVIHNLSCDSTENTLEKLLELKAVRVVVELALSSAGGGVKLKRLVANTLVNLSKVDKLLACSLASADARIIAGLQSVAVAGDGQTLENIGVLALRLSCIPQGRDAMVKQCATPVLTRIVGCSTGHEHEKQVPVLARRLLTAALRNLSALPESHPQLISCNGAILNAVDTMLQPSLVLSMRLDSALLVCNLLCESPQSRAILVKADVLSGLKQLAKAIAHIEGTGSKVLAKIMRELTSPLRLQTKKRNVEDEDTLIASLDVEEEDEPVVEEDAVKTNLSLAQGGAMQVCSRLAKREDPEVKHDVATAICNLCAACSPNLPRSFVDDGLVSALFWLTLQDCLSMTRPILRECAVALRFVVQSDLLRPHACADSNLVPLLIRLASFQDDGIRYDAAVAIYYVLMNEISHRSMVRQGLVKLLVDLAKTSTSVSVREVCSAALHQLPSTLLTNMDGEMLAVLMGLLVIKDAEFTDPSLYVPDRSCMANKPWVLSATSKDEAASLLDEAMRKKRPKAEWPTAVVDKSMPTFVPAKFALDATQGENVNPSSAKMSASFVGAYQKAEATSPSQLNQASLKLSLEAWLAGEVSEDAWIEKQQKAMKKKSEDSKSIADRLVASSETEKPKKKKKAARAQQEALLETASTASSHRMLPSIDGRKPTTAEAKASRASQVLANKSISSAFTSPKNTTTQQNTRKLHSSSSLPNTNANSIKRKQFAVSKRRAQHDRVADDYFELLYTLA